MDSFAFGAADADDDWLDTEALARDIRERSAARRADPVAYAFEVLHELSIDRTQDEFRRAWQRMAENQPWNAEDALFALRAVLASPPAHVADRLRTDAHLNLYHPGSATPFSDAEALAWLRQLEQDFSQAYDARTREQGV